MLTSFRTFAFAALILSVACGDDGGPGTGVNSDAAVDGDGSPIVDGGGFDFADADPNASDAGPGGCTAAGPQCNNCVDDDGDGLIDGLDPHCISALDDQEDSFATGIPGDNKDAVNQDCFFDGDSGGGNDGCNIHVCCLLDGECPADLRPDKYDPNECTVSQECTDNCGALTPAGCDCFSCCTICNDVDGCVDVLTNPAVAPDCDVDVITDPALCPPCIKNDTCGTDCDPTNCILCPGQTEEDLPPECNNMNVCPEGQTVCDTSDDCTAVEYCNKGCCTESIQ